METQRKVLNSISLLFIVIIYLFCTPVQKIKYIYNTGWSAQFDKLVITHKSSVLYLIVGGCVFNEKLVKKTLFKFKTFNFWPKLKGTVSVISIDPPFKECLARFTTLTDEGWWKARNCLNKNQMHVYSTMIEKLQNNYSQWTRVNF